VRPPNFQGWLADIARVLPGGSGRTEGRKPVDDPEDDMEDDDDEEDIHAPAPPFPGEDFLSWAQRKMLRIPGLLIAQANTAAEKLGELLARPGSIPGWIGRRIFGEAEWEAWRNLVFWTGAFAVLVGSAYVLSVYMKALQMLTRPFVWFGRGLLLFKRLMLGEGPTATLSEAGTAVPLLYGPDTPLKEYG